MSLGVVKCLSFNQNQSWSHAQACLHLTSISVLLQGKGQHRSSILLTSFTGLKNSYELRVVLLNKEKHKKELKKINVWTLRAWHCTLTSCPALQDQAHQPAGVCPLLLHPCKVSVAETAIAAVCVEHPIHGMVNQVLMAGNNLIPALQNCSGGRLVLNSMGRAASPDMLQSLNYIFFLKRKT